MLTNEIDSENHIKIYEGAIRRTFPDLKFNSSLLIDDEYHELFCERKVNCYLSREDYYSTQFHLSGYIDKVSWAHQMRCYPVNVILYVGHKR